MNTEITQVELPEVSPDDAPVIAFFDLDLTLLDCNSAKLWVKRSLNEGDITKVQAMQSLYWITAYHLGFVKLHAVMDDAMQAVTGMPAVEMMKKSDAFWGQEVRHRFRPGALQQIQKHKERGHRIVLLTSSTNFLAERAAAYLGFDGFLCTHFGVDRGKLNGTARGGFCYGRGKVDKAMGYAHAHGIKLEDCYFYTDSFSDLPPLLAVGHPVVVHPDHRLRKKAREMDWPVMDWGVSPSHPSEVKKAKSRTQIPAELDDPDTMLDQSALPSLL